MPLHFDARAPLIGTILTMLLAVQGPGFAQARPLVTPLQQAVAEAATADAEIAAFYRGRGFAPLWLGEGAGARRAAFLAALDMATDHGLPAGRYDTQAIRAAFATADGVGALGALDVEMTRRLVRFARDAASGIVDPRRVDPTIKVAPPSPEMAALLERFATGDPDAVLRALWPATPAYNRLLRTKLRLREMRDRGGWGEPIAAGPVLARGAQGPRVVALRERLVAMGYLRPSVVAEFDTAMERAITAFQGDHGLAPDGEAGPATLAAINVPIEDRLSQVVANLERQRWMNKPLEPRHILVNLAEQHAYVVDDGRVTFDTVVVIGADTPDRRTPEFSDTMTHMVINPSWYVPRSIAVKEYLPALRRGGARHLEVHSSAGRVNPARVNFSAYTERTFPFSLRQPPGPNNALGKVKFMFPNQWNIYLHDTPAKSLFGHEVRTFSHGCVRVARPEELAYHLLAAQVDEPRGLFDGIARSGRERRVDLETPIGVHLVYWSAWVTPEGRLNFRGDPYGRDAALLGALREAGVELAAGRS